MNQRKYKQNTYFSTYMVAIGRFWGFRIGIFALPQLGHNSYF
jgi:hypothetical protein